MDAAITEATAVATQFATHFYNTFDTNRQQLHLLYDDNVSLMTFEGATVTGKQKIIEKLVSLPFQTVKHILTTVDGQPTIDQGIMILVVGQLKTDNDPAHAFSEQFHLKKVGDSYVILNQSFRLSIHHG